MAIEIENIYKRIKDGSPGNLLSTEQIQAFKYKKTKDFFRRMIMTIWLNTGIKYLMVAGLTGLIIFSAAKPDTVMLLVVLLAACAGLIVYEMSLTKSLKIISEGTERTSALIRRMDRFLTVQFLYFRMIGSLTNPILVLTGIFYYQFFKRKEIGFTDMEDIIVTFIMLIISYLIALFSNNFTKQMMSNELSDLQQIEEDSAATLLRRRKKKIAITVISLAIFLLGLFLFLILAIKF